MDPAVLEPLQDYLDQVTQSVEHIADTAGPLEAVGSLLAPRLPQPPGVLASAAEFQEPCSEPDIFEPFCHRDNCWELECTGVGAGWKQRYYLEATPLEAGGWKYEHVLSETAWNEGQEGITFTTSAAITDPDGRDWSFEASGSAPSKEEGLVTMTFDGLFEAGTGVLTYSWSSSSVSRAIQVGDVEVATGDAGGWQATVPCP